MKSMIRTTMFTAAAFTALAAPALADSVNCVVTAPEIRVRKSPSKHAQVTAVLKKDTRATAVDKCSGGWVKITANDGGLSGYVGGWALADVAPKSAAPTATPAVPEVVKAPVAPVVVTPTEVPNNEMLAVQITELRLKVVGLGRDMDVMKKDIRTIKVRMAHRGRHKHRGKR